MELGPVIKHEKRNKTRVKIEGDLMSANCEVIVIFLFVHYLGQSRRRVCKTFPLIVTFYFTETENKI